MGRRKIDEITFRHVVWIGDVSIYCEFAGEPDQGSGTGFFARSIRALRACGGGGDLQRPDADCEAILSELASWATLELLVERERLEVAAQDAARNEEDRSHDD